MKRNKRKRNVLLRRDEILPVKLCASLISSSKCEKLLGVKIDNNLMFDEDIRRICKKSKCKIKRFKQS